MSGFGIANMQCKGWMDASAAGAGGGEGEGDWTVCASATPLALGSTAAVVRALRKSEGDGGLPLVSLVALLIFAAIWSSNSSTSVVQYVPIPTSAVPGPPPACLMACALYWNCSTRGPPSTGSAPLKTPKSCRRAAGIAPVLS